MDRLKVAFFCMFLLAAGVVASDLLSSRPFDRQAAASTGAAAWPPVDAAAAPRPQVADDPQQENVRGLPPLDYNGYQLRPLASYRLAARVLGREPYRFGREADLSPVDFALGWGPMAEDRVLAKIEVSQSNRFFYWKTPDYPIPRADIESHASNVHLIPANRDVARALDAVDVDDEVALGGYLVEVSADDGWHWTSSLSRTDTGKGACELLYVESVARP